ncbi:MAG: NAD(P)-dependent oxidoreductase [Chloroflexota bacterium]
MRILITGGSGRLGYWTVTELENDFDVAITDRHNRVIHGNASLIQADLTDLGQVYSVMAGVDAVVHLAAIPSPIGVTPDVVFENNIMGTFNVTEAASNLGIKKLIYTSSCSAYGFAFRTTDMVPDYLPLDEEHPARPQDAYGLSKLFGEEMVAAASRRTEMMTVAMRIPTVLTPEQYAEEVPKILAGPGVPAIGAYVDARDVAQAIRLALENDELTGYNCFCIAAEDSFSRQPLFESFPISFPGSEQVAAGLTGIQSSVSIEKAKRVLGYQPRYSWRSLVRR